MHLQKIKNNQKKYLIINEEYGYRYWIAECDSNMAINIKNWWTGLPTVLGMFFNPNSQFPIKLVELNDETEDAYDLDISDVAVYIELHEDNDSSLKIGDKRYYHAGWTD